MIISSTTADTIYMSASALTVIFGITTTVLAIRKHRWPRENRFDALTLWATVATTALAAVVFFTSSIRDDYSNIRVSENEKITAAAYEAAAVAKKEASEAVERTVLIQNENSQLLIRVETERAARLALEKKIAPRRISSYQKQKLIEVLRPFAGQIIRVISPPTAEQTDLAVDFVDIFRKAGWRIVSSNDTFTGVDRLEYIHEPQGIQLAVDPLEPQNSKTRQAFEALRKFLFAEGLTILHAPVQLSYESLPGIIELVTARKPD